MNRIFRYCLIFLLGLVFGLLYLQKSKKEYQSNQIDILHNGIKNVSKLVVTEASYSEIYSYNDVKKYLFETLQFEKKVILSIHAKIQVSYDMKKIDIEIDSVRKKLIINNLPKEELTVIPDIKYYDLQQSVWNTFTKEELNRIQKSSIEKLMQTAKVAEVKLKARKRLVEELRQLFNLTDILGWVVEDNTGYQLLEKDTLPEFKD